LPPRRRRDGSSCGATPSPWRWWGWPPTIGALARRHLALPDLVMLYLLVVMVAAARFGRGQSLVAATLSVLAFDFFFIPPYFTFTSPRSATSSPSP
jgi:hypothetical protein